MDVGELLGAEQAVLFVDQQHLLPGPHGLADLELHKRPREHALGLEEHQDLRVAHVLQLGVGRGSVLMVVVARLVVPEVSVALRIS